MATMTIRTDARSCVPGALTSTKFANHHRALAPGACTRDPAPGRFRPTGVTDSCCKTHALLQPFESRDGTSRAGLSVDSLGMRPARGDHGPADDESVWDVVGLGQAMVDLGAQVDDATLAQVGVEKGGRRVVDVDERAELVQRLDGAYTVRAGSSLSNTLVAMSRLATADASLPGGGKKLKIGMAGCVGADVQGEFFKAQLRRAGVEFLSEPVSGTLTGSVIVLTTSDAQRSFVSFPGSPEYAVDEALKRTIASSKVLLIEGYLVELPGSLARIKQAVAMAKESGTVVVLTAGDAGLVARHRRAFREIIHLGTDILFTNHHEAAAMLDVASDQVSAHDAALKLAGDCPMVVVTDGCKGSYLTGMGKLQVVPPCWTKEVPVDTCGAGDVYSAGVLYGFLRGFDMYGMGQTGARAASAIICKHGGRMSVEDAESVVADIGYNPGIRSVFPIQNSREMQLRQEV